MPIADHLLALLNDQPRSAAQLRRELMSLTDSGWPRELDRVVQLLSRMEEDGQVTSTDHPARYSATDRGKERLSQWWTQPVAFVPDDRDDLIFKISLAAARGEDELIRLLDAQQRCVLGELRALAHLSRTIPATRTAARLRLERHIFDLEAESRWLSRIEALASPPPPGKEPRHATPQSA